MNIIPWYELHKKKDFKTIRTIFMVFSIKFISHGLNDRIKINENISKGLHHFVLFSPIVLIFKPPTSFPSEEYLLITVYFSL